MLFGVSEACVPFQVAGSTHHPHVVHIATHQNTGVHTPV